MKLSQHFTLQELTKSSTALRLRIVNDPGALEIENLKQVCSFILEPVRTHYKIPFSPSSGYRCPNLNKAIGSKSTSQHVKGQAVDFELPGISNFEIASWMKQNLTFDQLILEFHQKEIPSSGWVHVSFVSPQTNREKASIFDGSTWTGF
jgi:zinc D-Ala-D-Ala carboxypeptidase